MHQHRRLAVIGVTFLALLATSCTTRPTPLDTTYGMSYHFAILSQMLHPNGSKPDAPPTTLDGRAAEQALARYRSTFAQPPRPPSFVISVGGIE